MTDDDIRALRDVLAGEPTPGPWYVDHDYPDTIEGHVAISAEYHSAFAQAVWSMEPDRERLMPSPCQETTANYIAAASPDRIARLIDEIERLRADAERLRAADERRKRRSVTYVCPQCAASMIRDGEKEERK